jgi:toxin ParE1/3/4
MHLEFSPLAQIDLEEIGDYIALDSPANAVRFIEGMRAQCRKLTHSPFAYVARPELGEGLRSCAHGRYIIFFRVSDHLVRIERVLHSSRDIDAALGATPARTGPASH